MVVVLVFKETLGSHLWGRTTTHASEKGSEKVLRKGSAWGKVLGKGSSRGLAMGFTVKGF